MNKKHSKNGYILHIYPYISSSGMADTTIFIAIYVEMVVQNVATYVVVLVMHLVSHYSKYSHSLYVNFASK